MPPPRSDSWLLVACRDFWPFPLENDPGLDVNRLWTRGRKYKHRHFTTSAQGPRGLRSPGLNRYIASLVFLASSSFSLGFCMGPILKPSPFQISLQKFYSIFWLLVNPQKVSLPAAKQARTHKLPHFATFFLSALLPSFISN